MANNSFSRFSDDQMAAVRQTDLPALLESLGYKVKPKGSYHTLADMPQIMIKRHTSYYDNYGQAWGDGITFLREFHGMEFEEAVNHLLAFNGHSEGKTADIKPAPPSASKQEPKAPFQLPEANADNRRVYAYLLKRGISRNVISDFMKSGLLYECKEYHNCNFVGKDQNGAAVFAYKRGTYDKNGDGFKGDVPSSDKSVAFRLPAHHHLGVVYVFESPLDLMPYCTLYRQLNSNAIALCCLDDGALQSYLKENPHITGIMLCLDVDKWGKEAVSRMQKKYDAQGYETGSHPPPKGKDWNEYLQLKKKKQHTR